MPPKGKGKGKGKKGKNADKEPSEPSHDPVWEKAVEKQIWALGPERLPDPEAWPTFGAIRERVLLSVRELVINWSDCLRDGLVDELAKSHLPELKKIDFHGSSRLERFVVSPAPNLPALEKIILDDCPNLNNVLIQSESLKKISFQRCANLKKLVLQCPLLEKVPLEECSSLETVMIWSDNLTEIDLTASDKLRNVQIYCPILDENKKEIPPLVVEKKGYTVIPHPPIVDMLNQMYWDKVVDQEEEKQKAKGNESIDFSQLSVTL